MSGVIILGTCFERKQSDIFAIGMPGFQCVELMCAAPLACVLSYLKLNSSCGPPVTNQGKAMRLYHCLDRVRQNWWRRTMNLTQVKTSITAAINSIM